MSNAISQIQVNGTTYEICDTTARDLIDQFYYGKFFRPAGNWSYAWYGGGFLTNGSADIRFAIPINNGAIDINRNPSITIDMDASTAAMRQNGGYIWGSSADRASLTGHTYTINQIYCNFIMLIIGGTWTPDNNAGSLTNNAPVGVDVLLNLTLTYGS